MRESERLRQLRLANSDEILKKKETERTPRRANAIAKGGSFAERLQQAGIQAPALVYILMVVGGAGFLTVALSKGIGGLVGLCVGPCIAFYFLSTHLTAKAEKRRATVVPHLPGFLDSLGASLGTGYNMETAVLHATNSLPDGILKTEFKKVCRLTQKGFTLDEALEFALRRISGQEIVSVVVTIRLFADMGGRGLEPFKRLGYKMREQQSVLERASRDLVGTKQAFYVIFALSVAAPVFLLVSEREYIVAAFQHPWITYLMQSSIVIQVVSFMLFRRITTLRV
ncbi:MAG: type II secretion system F family protein [Bdellovibrionales bacterium]|nr:type II secretion system F family protein [Bdellovibrionales bacterium]